MNYIKRLKKENKIEELTNYIKNNYGKPNWDYKIVEVDNDAELNLLIDETDKGAISWHVLTEFNCEIPQDLETSSMFIDEVDNEKVRKLYLKFMKKAFPEYKDAYIENVQLQATKAIAEIISL